MHELQALNQVTAGGYLAPGNDQVHKLIHEIANDTESFITRVQASDSVLNNTIEPYPDIDYLKQFAVSYYWTGSKIVNVFEVVGTAHPDYIGAAWITMLRLGKRMRSINLPLLQENPGYYFDTADKEPEMHYARINGHLYISGEGNHRTSIAKALFAFLGLQKFGAVKYEEYLVDEDAMTIFQEVHRMIREKALPIDIHPVKENYKREDTPGWKKDYYRLSFKLVNYKKDREIVINKEELKILGQELAQASLIKKIFKRGKYLDFLF
ncbi:MAG: hypothetical protein AB1424_01705 [Thermodesulfobacteriota bacterium]